MKRSFLPFLLIPAVLALLASTPGAGPGDLTLFDAPRGAWLGTLRPDAPVVVLGEEDGWRRIRVEAWVSASSAVASPSGGSTGQATPPSRGQDSGGSPTARHASSPGATIRGVLTADGNGPAGSSLIVLLVANLEAMDREHSRAGEGCAGRLAGIDARIASLREEGRRALNSTDNFREATTRSDRAKQELKGAEAERRDALRACRETAEGIFQRHAVERTISDHGGRYDFLDIPPGRYRVIATRTAEPTLAWSLDCAIEGGETIILDPAVHRSPVEPFWGLD
ncbi:MAG: hypothetical protein O7A63_01500 [Acidobacteria bacterium]|nr:hypothetical protein [Acidobacteriota bacterium]